MSIKIVFFDMDGTLVDYGSPMPAPDTMLALRQLADQGIKIVISTGRPPYVVPHFPGIHWNASITFNGALVQSDQKCFMKTRSITKILKHCMNGA